MTPALRERLTKVAQEACDRACQMTIAGTEFDYADALALLRDHITDEWQKTWDRLDPEMEA